MSKPEVCPVCRGGPTFVTRHHKDRTAVEQIPCPACGITPADASGRVLKADDEGRPRLAAPPAAPKKKEHPFLAADLYEKCPACAGTCRTRVPAMVDKMKVPTGGTYSGPLAVGSPCPMCAGETPGFVKTGLTVGQVERFRAQLEILTAFARSVKEHGRENNVVTIVGEARAALERARLLPPGRTSDTVPDQVQDEGGDVGPPKAGEGG